MLLLLMMVVVGGDELGHTSPDVGLALIHMYPCIILVYRTLMMRHVDGQIRQVLLL